VGELLIAIQIYIDARNADPKPFVWTASAETMLMERLCSAAGVVLAALALR
jgi:hypothetical protein